MQGDRQLEAKEVIMKKVDKNKSLMIHTAVLIVVFYLIPFLFRGSIATLFLINPLAVFICSLIYSKNYKFNLLTVIISAALFYPSIYIFYNESAWIYVLFYAVFSLVGNLTGCVIHQKKC